MTTIRKATTPARMSSWRLFTYLTPYGSPRLHRAIWRRELKRAPSWASYDLWLRVREWTALLFVVIILFFVASWCLAPWIGTSRAAVIPWPVVCSLAVPLVLLPSLVVWIVPLGLIIGPSIARERMDRTWDVLRATPTGIDAILLTKLYAANWPFHPIYRRVGTVILLASLVVATLSVNLLDSLTMTYLVTYLGICVAGLVFLVLGAAVFILDRMQQFVLMGVVALAVSVSARSVQRSVIQATVAVALVWLADVGIAVVALAALPRWVSLSVSSQAILLVMFGPLGGYLAELHIHAVLICIVATFAMRELMIRMIWSWTVCKAQS